MDRSSGNVSLGCYKSGDYVYKTHRLKENITTDNCPVYHSNFMSNSGLFL
ncbi:hypothetical protein EXN66_Car005061 [Channa argus]|uniref:Uncharacterized protein n=1 Tax=Channa argus TaxID=215402 RepID=A0A6G1PGQ5_CHAAH|nr:hypothetical protein EXN66_Car005061 [Channa argus]